MVQASKKLRPRDATTHEKILALKRDNKSVRNGWMILNGNSRVVLTNQRVGEESTGKVEFTIREFNCLVDWWNGV